MEQKMDRFLGQMLDGRYETLEIIGSGGMAVVYKALCHRLNRYVAVKVLKDEYALNDEFRERFKAESQAVAMLSHPNIVAVYDFSKTSDCQYIVMELLEGITLKQYMRTKGALSWKEALHFATQTAKALSHAHSKGVIHRDIKPQNIMVVKDGSIKVADFGIAYLQNERHGDYSETMGSIHYISPEQARGEPLDARSDIYSLGVVMYEMLTGTLPYGGDTIESVALQHFGSSLTMPGEISPDIPPELERIALKAMSSNTAARYQSAQELLSDLENFRKQMLAEENSELLPAAVSAESGQRKYRMKPLSRKGELSKRDYARRKIRSRKVATFSGFALVGIFLFAVVAFLWGYWIKDMFVDMDRVSIPSFVGEQVSEIVDSQVYDGLFNFTVIQVINPDVPEGTITGQDPAPGRSIIPTRDGIDIEFTVSTGVLLTQVPDLVNREYREATIALEKLSFEVEVVPVASDKITKDYVVETSPKADEKLPAGSTVTIYVSGGPQLMTVDMPNVVGKLRDSAVALLAENYLTVGSISEVHSDTFASGVIVWQSISPGTEVTGNSVVYLQVSIGPKPTPPPSEDPDTSGESGGSENSSGTSEASAAGAPASEGRSASTGE